MRENGKNVVQNGQFLGNIVHVPNEQFMVNMTRTSTKPELATYHHQSLGSPPISSVLQAVSHHLDELLMFPASVSCITDISVLRYKYLGSRTLIARPNTGLTARTIGTHDRHTQQEQIYRPHNLLSPSNDKYMLLNILSTEADS